MEWTRRWSPKSLDDKKLDDISTWSSGEIKMIQVTEGYSLRPLALQVREFVPIEWDLLQRHWVANGFKKSVTLPPYAIVDLAVAETAYWGYINQAGAEFFKRALNYKDKLLWATYDTAIWTANNPETVSSPMDAWYCLLTHSIAWDGAETPENGPPVVGGNTDYYPIDSHSWSRSFRNATKYLGWNESLTWQYTYTTGNGGSDWAYPHP
jgi:hypothetical protein